ncbi:MAG: sulfate adenylyltransferase subunit CysN [Polyangiales bacterium]
MVAEAELIESDIEAYLAKYRQKELLRFVAVGSVDDGKSTLIGRLLHDTGMVYEDQLDAVKRASAIEGEEIDFSLFTDGLKAEREQGITIDVAYRYFSTEKRKFIIADTPGHIQYTRNMVTGASTADVALILIDARLGVLQQSRRHAYIANLLGIPHLCVCVNKMDLVNYDKSVFDKISADFASVGETLGFKDVTFFPVSALKGDNIVSKSEKTPWYKGKHVLEYLETVPIGEDRNLHDFRFPVQYVIRPNLDYRGFSGEVASGLVNKGDKILSLPSGKSTTVTHIDTFDGELNEAFAKQAVVLRLADEIDISRGDMIVKSNNMPKVVRDFDAHIVWMSETPLDTDKGYYIKHTSQQVRAQLSDIRWKKDMDTLKEVEANELSLNDIGRVRIQAQRALYVDDYGRNRVTGAFIVIDSLTNDTVGAGMVIDERGGQNLDDVMKELHAGSALTPKSLVSAKERRERMGQEGATVWLSGLPGSGRWTLAYALERRLFDLGRTATVFDPSGQDFQTMTHAAKLASDAGLINICAFPTFQQSDRETLRSTIGAQRVLVVYVNTDPALCAERRPDTDAKGWEAPQHPDVEVALDKVRVDVAVEAIVDALREREQF